MGTGNSQRASHGAKKRSLAPVVIATLTFVFAALPLCGAVTSANHPVLKRLLAEDPGTDDNKDGVLDLEEFTGARKKHNSRKKKDDEAFVFLPEVRADGEIVISEFEDTRFRLHEQAGWTIEGDAFPRDLHPGTSTMRKRAGIYRGKYLLSTFIGSDAATGKIESSPIRVEADYILATMSGGHFPHRVCINFVVDDEVVRTATGRNDDQLEKVAFEVREFLGRTGRLQIIDRHRDLWGHLNVDRIIMTDEPGEARLISERPATPSSPADLVQTNMGTTRGPLRFEAGGVMVGELRYELQDLLLAINGRPREEVSAGSALRLGTGETWHATIRGLENGELRIHSKLFGERTVPLAKVVSLEFQPASSSAPREPGHLYRSKGPPIPGKLVWVREKDIAIDCPLGVVPIPRELVQRYVVAAPAAAPRSGPDELRLTDGSVLRGTARVEEDHLVLDHDFFGDVELAWEAIHALRRTPLGVTWLGDLDATVVEQVGPALPPPAPQRIESESGSHLSAIRIMPRTVARYPLPAQPGYGRLFSAAFAPLPGATTEIEVRLRVGDTVVWHQRLAPNSPPVPFSGGLPSEGDLTIEVDHAGALSFPCGVDLRDAFLLAVPESRAEPNPDPQD